MEEATEVVSKEHKYIKKKKNVIYRKKHNVANLCLKNRIGLTMFILTYKRIIFQHF